MAKKNIIKYIIIAVIGGGFFLPPFAKYQELRYKNWSLEQNIKKTEIKIKQLEAEKRRLETDITYIEKKARDKIGVVRKGEIIIKSPQAKK